MNNRFIKLSPNVLFQEVRGETVLLNLDNEKYFGLDETATFFFKLLQDDGDLKKAFNTMLDEFEVDAEQLKTDLDNLVEKMLEAGLIEISD
jgi:division protein CdvB (Snf7/Vps24/ESCRT-III family)